MKFLANLNKIIINIKFFNRIKKGFLFFIKGRWILLAIRWIKKKDELLNGFGFLILILLGRFVDLIKEVFLCCIEGIRWVKGKIEKILASPILIALLLLISIGFLLRKLILKEKIIYEGAFIRDIITEIHGLLFDIFVFGIVIVIFNKIGEKRRNIKRYKEEIADFRDWDEKEAKFRIVGNIRRLNNNGFFNIDLHNCYLKDAKLENAKLRKANIKYANLQGAKLIATDLRKANLEYANLQEAELNAADLRKANLKYANLKKAELWQANLQGAELFFAKNLTIEQLSGVKTLYGALLDRELEIKIEEEYSHLFKKQKEKEENT